MARNLKQMSELDPLLVEVMKKAAVVWLQVVQKPPRAVWTMWHNGAAYVVHGGDEQQVPGLAEAPHCTVICRSADNHARIASWPASVTQVGPESDEWAEVVPLLVLKRLNLLDTPTAAQRWARSSIVSRLTPTAAQN